MTPLQELAKELKAAAKKYTDLTGKKFKANFMFYEQVTLENTGTNYYVAGVSVESTNEEIA